MVKDLDQVTVKTSYPIPLKKWTCNIDKRIDFSEKYTKSYSNRAIKTFWKNAGNSHD